MRRALAVVLLLAVAAPHARADRARVAERLEKFVRTAPKQSNGLAGFAVESLAMLDPERAAAVVKASPSSGWIAALTRGRRDAGAARAFAGKDGRLDAQTALEIASDTAVRDEKDARWLLDHIPATHPRRALSAALLARDLMSAGVGSGAALLPGAAIPVRLTIDQAPWDACAGALEAHLRQDAPALSRMLAQGDPGLRVAVILRAVAEERMTGDELEKLDRALLSATVDPTQRIQLLGRIAPQRGSAAVDEALAKVPAAIADPPSSMANAAVHASVRALATRDPERARETGTALVRAIAARADSRQWAHMIGSTAAAMTPAGPKEARALLDTVKLMLEWRVNALRAVYRKWGEVAPKDALAAAASEELHGGKPSRITLDLTLEAAVGAARTDPALALAALEKLPEDRDRYEGFCLIAPSLARTDLAKALALLDGPHEPRDDGSAVIALCRIAADLAGAPGRITADAFFPDFYGPVDRWPGPEFSRPLRFKSVRE